MLQEAISAVASVLSEAFPYPVYTEAHRQGAKSPAFFVSAEDYTAKQRVGGRREIRFRVEILYLPPDDGQRSADALQTGEKLERLFCRLPLPGGDAPCFQKKFGFRDLTRGFSRGYQITDKVLVFSFVLDLFVYEEPDGETMRQYELLGSYER